MKQLIFFIGSLIEKYNYYVNELPDPRTKVWVLMSGPWLPISVVGIYLYLIYFALPKFMEKRKPYQLKTVMQLYNIFQIILCAGITIGMFSTGKPNFWIGCYPTNPSPEDPLAVRMTHCGWWTYVAKHFDFLDTIFFSLRKKYKQISVLHVYHHVGTFFITYLAVRYIPGGMAAFPAFINSFVHVIMYCYYFLAATGPTMQEKLVSVKPMVTVLQMIQLCFIIAVGVIALSPDCDVPVLIAWIYIPNIAGFLLLFANFFVQNYLRKSKQKSG